MSAVKQKNLDIYGDKPIPWARALEQLDAGISGSCWLATTRPDPTVGLVLYDLRSCLRNAAVTPPKPKRPRPKKPAAPPEGGGDAAA